MHIYRETLLAIFYYMSKLVKILVDITSWLIDYLLNLLKEKTLSAGEISEKFDISFAAISRHLSVLKEADLIRDERDGKFIYYTINASVLEEILLWIKDLKGDAPND